MNCKKTFDALGLLPVFSFEVVPETAPVRQSALKVSSLYHKHNEMSTFFKAGFFSGASGKSEKIAEEQVKKTGRLLGQLFQRQLSCLSPSMAGARFADCVLGGIL